MGCNISRPELRGRGKDPNLLSFNHHNAEDIPRGDPIFDNPQRPVSPKLVIKQIIGRNSDVSIGKGKKDYVLGSSNELLLPDKDKGGLEDHPPPSHVSSLHAAAVATKSSENPRPDALIHPKTNYNHTGNDAVDLEGRGAVIPKYEGPLWIASPSFRDYCNAGSPDGNSDDDDGDGFRVPMAKDNNNNNNNNNAENRRHWEKLTHLTKDAEMNKENHINVTKDAEITRSDENSSSHQHSTDSTNQNVKRRRNLRKVLTLHRPAAVRNLFSVGGCYNPLAPSSAHTGARKPPNSKPL